MGIGVKMRMKIRILVIWVPSIRNEVDLQVKMSHVVVVQVLDSK